MNICHIITRMILGGAQENTLLTLEYLKNHTPWNIHLAYGPELDEGSLVNEVLKLGVHVHPLKFLKRNLNPVDDVRAYFELIHLFSKNNFDLVHTHSSKAGIIGRIAATQAKVPKIVHTIHGLAFDEYQPIIKNFIFRTSEEIASSHCDAIITVCNTMTKLARDQGLGNHAPIETIYSGFDLAPFLNVEKREADGRFVIGMIARMFPFKGYEDFIKLAEPVLSKNKDIDFYLVGDGPLRSMLESWIGKHPDLRYRIVFSGRVPREEIPQHLEKMDMLIHLSWREGLPRTVAQALAAAKPVCVYDIGGASEIVINGLTGFLVPPGDIQEMETCINKIHSNTVLAEEMGIQGRNMTRAKFAVETMGEKIVGLYNRLEFQN
jgi:glycosyltransferase involved in cell wall biosynthesis